MLSNTNQSLAEEQVDIKDHPHFLFTAKYINAANKAIDSLHRINDENIWSIKVLEKLYERAKKKSEEDTSRNKPISKNAIIVYAKAIANLQLFNTVSYEKSLHELQDFLSDCNIYTPIHILAESANNTIVDEVKMMIWRYKSGKEYKEELKNKYDRYSKRLKKRQLLINNTIKKIHKVHILYFKVMYDEWKKRSDFGLSWETDYYKSLHELQELLWNSIMPKDE